MGKIGQSDKSGSCNVIVQEIIGESVDEQSEQSTSASIKLSASPA
jgi:hypothetical protein